MDKTQEGIQKIAYALVILVFTIIILYNGAFIIVPLVWGVFFAFSLYPLTNWLEEKRIPRALAILLGILIVLVIALGIIYLLFNQMLALLADIPEIGGKLTQKLDLYLSEIQSLFGVDFGIEDEKWTFANLFSGEMLNSTLFSTGKSLTLAAIIPLYIFLLLYYKDFFIEFLFKFSDKTNSQILAWAADSGKVIQGYLIGIVKVTSIVAILAGIFFYFLGIKYYLLFAAWIAIMNLIPYIGVIVSSALVILYVFLTTDTFIYPLITLAVLWGIQIVENNLITPWVVGSKVNVNAFVVILAILMGGGLWGISGMVLFIPITGILKITFDRIDGLKPYGFLMGDNIVVTEKNENFWRIFRKKFWK